MKHDIIKMEFLFKELYYLNFLLSKLSIPLMNEVYNLPVEIKCLFFPFYSTHFMKPSNF